jgi:soluble lytic murein transglycosylase
MCSGTKNSIYGMKLSIKHFKFLAFFLMKSFLLTSFNGSALAAYDHDALDKASKSEWSQSLSMAEDMSDTDTKHLALWMYAVSDNKKAQLDARVSASDIKDLIETKSYWPQQTPLKTIFEAKIPFERHDFDVVAWFDKHEPETSRGMKIYLAALEKADKWDAVKKTINQWWGVALVDPKDQTYLLKRYGRYIERDSHIKRLEKLTDRGHYTNARKIAKLLGADYSRLTEARIILRQDIRSDRSHSDGAVSQAISRVPAAMQEDAGLIYDRLKWRRVKKLNSRAMDILLDPPEQVDIVGSEGLWWRERHILVRRLIDDKKYKDAYEVASSHKQKSGVNYTEAEWLSGWLSLQFVGDAKTALKHFYAMKTAAKTPITLSRHYYWLGRSFDALGDVPNAKANYGLAASFPTTYYGLLAHEHSEVAVHNIGKMTSPIIGEDKRVALAGDLRLSDMFNAAQALQAVGYNLSANGFLTAASDLGADRDLYKHYVTEKSAEIGKINISVLLSRRAAMKHVFYAQNHAYPLMLDAMNGVGDAEWALVHGIIRQESLFDQNAQSGVGARGLMQLMPRTAQAVAKGLNISYQQDWLKERPAFNVQLGAEYIDELLEKYDGAYPLAIAAYNAGPNRVNSWLKEYGDPRSGAIDWVDWIELIPFSETRNYVMRVNEATFVYRYLLQNVQPSIELGNDKADTLFYGIAQQQ